MDKIFFEKITYADTSVLTFRNLHFFTYYYNTNLLPGEAYHHSGERYRAADNSRNRRFFSQNKDGSG
jgi:hypothetical protein